MTTQARARQWAAPEHWRASVVVLAMAPALLVGNALAQDRCSSQLEAAFAEFRHAAAAGGRTIPELPVFAILDSATGEWARQFRQQQSHASARAASPDLSSDSLVMAHPGMASDSGTLSDAGLVLSGIMQGELAGFTEDQAWLAVWLYRRLGAPPIEAARLLADPADDGAMVVRSIIALGHRVQEPPAIRALLARLCLLDARMEGTARVLRRAHIEPDIGDILSRSDAEVLGEALTALSDSRSGRPKATVRLSELLEAESPLAVFIRVVWPPLW